MGDWLTSSLSEVLEFREGPGIMAAGSEVLVNPIGFDTGANQRVTLRRQRLAAVALRDACVADEHGRETARKDGWQGATLR